MDINLTNLCEIFFNMEESEDLFARRLDDGTFYWDLIRLNVFYCLHTMHGGPYNMPSTCYHSSFADKAKDLVRGRLNRVTRGYLESQRPEYIFVTGQRIKSGEMLIDNISDHLFDLMAEKSVAVETMNRRAISGWSILARKQTRVPPTFLYANPPVEDLRKVCNDVTANVKRHFNCSINVECLIRDPIATYRQYRDYYLRLLSAHRPRAIILINNGSFKGLFDAAKEKQVPTLELQHGVSSAHNVFWSYPASVNSDTPGLILPSAYLTFSEYWRTNANYPVKSSWAIGNDFFYQEPTAGDDSSIVIISAYMYHEKLLKLSFQLADVFPGKTIYYKLHPHQFKDKIAIVAAAKVKSNIRIVSDEIDVPSLFRACGFVVGVHSTLLYSALQAGKKVCVYKRDNYFWHEDIYEYVELFDDISGLKTVIADHHRHFRNLGKRPSLFDPFSADKFKIALLKVEGSST